MFLSIMSAIKYNKAKQIANENFELTSVEYDPETGLLYTDQFYKKIKDYILLSTNLACMVSFHAENLEHLYRSQKQLSNQIFDYTSILIPDKQSTFFSGSKSRHECLVFIYGGDKETILNTLNALHQDLKAGLHKLLKDESLCSIKCGYTWYPSQSQTLEDLITNTNYALFEAICFNKMDKNEFTPSSFQKQKQELIRNDQFERLINNNFFLYHFQPIISAKNGDIYAYEALMRTDESIGLTPLEVLEIAERQKKLYEIEYYTFFNTMKFYKDNVSDFGDKYLFINCLPNQLLTKEDFDSFYRMYHTLTHKIIVEASEIYLHTEEEHLLLQERINTLGSQLALDDYGSGYGNELNLLKYNPRYIKIDRSLISNINNDEKKRHLVANIIQFAKQNGMIALAEGVETFKELHTVIYLGVDLLQGFYLYRPSAELLPVLPQKQKDEIIAINRKYFRSNATNETYIADTTTALELANLHTDNYSSLVINTENLKLSGDVSTQYTLTITVPDNSSVTLDLENVNIKAKDDFCINIGRNCKVALRIKENNMLTGQGIHVPESSSLSISGSGNLAIRTEVENGIGVGESPFNTYGSITCDITGKMTVINRNKASICIGGGKGGKFSKIELLGGIYELSTDGLTAIGIGCLNGQANIQLGNIKLNILCNGNNSIGIGSFNGSLNLSSTADIRMVLTGQNSCCIGILSNLGGNILLHDGIVKLKVNAKDGCAIGSLNGSLYINVAVKEFICHAEGIHICGIGNYSGGGVTEIEKGTISIKLASSNKLYLGSQNGPLLINGGNINCPINRIIEPINKYRMPLKHYRFTDYNTFKRHIEIDNLAYEYEAYTTASAKDINVYLPELDEYEQYLCS